jgi:RNA polymerase sigma-70 factor (ECF subfamily)
MNGFRFPTTQAEVIELQLDQAALRALAESSELEHLVAEVFAVLKDPVYRYLVSLLGTPAVAEDVLQETFVKLLRQLQRGQAVEQVRAWVFRVAHNTAISELRRRHRHEADFPADWESLAVLQPTSEPNAEQRLLEAERHSKLQHGLRLLSAQERYCLELKAEGLSYREIAAVLDISFSSVATYLTRGVRKMTRYLQ